VLEDVDTMVTCITFWAKYISFPTPCFKPFQAIARLLQTSSHCNYFVHLTTYANIIDCNIGSANNFSNTFLWNYTCLTLVEQSRSNPILFAYLFVAFSTFTSHLETPTLSSTCWICNWSCFIIIKDCSIMTPLDDIP
jgi:hypothetical protein